MHLVEAKGPCSPRAVREKLSLVSLRAVQPGGSMTNLACAWSLGPGWHRGDGDVRFDLKVGYVVGSTHFLVQHCTHLHSQASGIRVLTEPCLLSHDSVSSCGEKGLY